MADQEAEFGLRSIAMPLRRLDGQVVAALNIGCSVAQATLETMHQRFLPRLLAEATRYEASCWPEDGAGRPRLNQGWVFHSGKRRCPLGIGKLLRPRLRPASGDGAAGAPGWPPAAARPFRNYAEARTALMAGQIRAMFDGSFILASLIRAGQIRGLTTGGPKRDPQLRSCRPWPRPGRASRPGCGTVSSAQPECLPRRSPASPPR